MIVGGSMPTSPRWAASSTSPTPNQPADEDSVVTSLRVDAVGQRGHEEPGVVAPHLAGRGDPPRPRPDRRPVDGQVVRAQQVTEGDRARLDLRPRPR